MLLADISFYLPEKKVWIHIKAGFIFDGASIPQPFWATTGSPMDEAHILSALFHDAIYVSERFTRRYCDWLFVDFMQNFDQVGWYKRNKMYIAVKGGGWTLWPHPEEEVKAARKLVVKEPIGSKILNK
jgi:hypothetical protein